MLLPLVTLLVGATPLLSLEPLAAPSTDDAAWIGPRTAELLVDRLRLLGLAVADPWGAGAQESRAWVLKGTVRPERVEAYTTPIRLELQLVQGGTVLRKMEVRGLADELPSLATQAALQVAGALERSVGPNAATELGLLRNPYAVEQLLGRARARLEAGEPRQAALLYERAATFGGLVIPEAIEGRHLAQAELVARNQATFGVKAELAQAAAERAEEAGRRGRLEEQQAALVAWLQFLPDRALRFRWVRAFQGTEVFLERGGRWLVDEVGPEKLRIDPRNGARGGAGPTTPGLVGLAGEEELVLVGRRLSRLAPGAKPTFAVTLPIPPRSTRPDAFVDCGSALAVLGQESVAWLDPSTGQVGQIGRGLEPIAADPAGVLVRPGKDAEVGLLRAGKKSTAWRVSIPDPIAAELTRDRAVILTAPGLVLLKTFDGKPVRAPLSVPLRNPRLLGADGRYAALGDAEGRAMIIDVLAGEVTATIQGPSPAVAAFASSEGLATLHETGDLLFFDRDGRLLDRALVPGRPLRMLRGSPEAPGPLVISDRGLYGYAETETNRDLSAWLALVSTLVQRGDLDRALGILDRMAERSAGGIAEIERQRAQLLSQRFGPQHPGVAAARRRAELAQDPSQALPPFSL